MGKKRTRNDETFGRLTHDEGNLWERPIKVHFLGRQWTVPLIVQISPETGVEQNQVLAYEAFNKGTEKVMRAAEKAIFDYYQSEIEDPDDDEVPTIKSLPEVFKLVKPEGIFFPYVCSQPTFGILCECTWEEEHGLAVKYEHGRVVEVGFQDIVL